MRFEKILTCDDTGVEIAAPCVSLTYTSLTMDGIHGYEYLVEFFYRKSSTGDWLFAHFTLTRSTPFDVPIPAGQFALDFILPYLSEREETQ